MVKSVAVFSPATVANVGAGFDMMGFAIDGLGDRMILRTNASEKISIKLITGDFGKISRIPAENTAGVALIHFMKYLDIRQGVELEIHKLSPVGSGMGSSASSAAAAVFGLNELLGNPVGDKLGLIPFALEGEKLASGCIHADNIAPAMLGGMLVVRSANPVDLIEIPVPDELCTVLVHPDLEILTKTARNLVPSQVSLNDTITQMANVAGFIMAMVNNDMLLLSRSFQDLLAEPYRAPLITGYSQVKQAALDNGAIGCSISGSGPTVFAFVTGIQRAEKIAAAMVLAFCKAGVTAHSYLSPINRTGTYSS